jgi:uncharacterized protein (DUF427 family)
MSLTARTRPFGERAAGRFNFDPPAAVVHVEAFRRRIRAVRDGRTVVDCDRALLVHETGQLPREAYHAEAVRIPGEQEPNVDGYVTVAWDAVDFRFEEDERVEVHPRDPYHRIDRHTSARKAEVSLDGVALAESKQAHRAARLHDPDRTSCAYKDAARHWDARIGARVERDVAWCTGRQGGRPEISERSQRKQPTQRRRRHGQCDLQDDAPYAGRDAGEHPGRDDAVSG